MKKLTIIFLTGVAALVLTACGGGGGSSTTPLPSDPGDTPISPVDGKVLKTGQIKSYDGEGNIVTDDSVKDDGYYQIGKARSYSRRGDVVIDNTTGLEWQDNESIEKLWITHTNYYARDYSNTSGDTAATYCSNLTLDGGGWRLPSIEELETLVDNGKHNPSVTENVFQHIFSSNYMSSNDINHTVWAVSLVSGSSGTVHKFFDNYVRCVRGGPLEPSDLSRSGEIVTDAITQLQWQDNEVVKTAKGTWAEAIDYCENQLALGGYDDWRLPNIKELNSIKDRTWFDPAIDTGTFVNAFSSYYWSSTTDASSSYIAWHADFKGGGSFSQYGYKDSNFYMRCVRGG